MIKNLGSKMRCYTGISVHVILLIKEGAAVAGGVLTSEGDT